MRKLFLLAVILILLVAACTNVSSFFPSTASGSPADALVLTPSMSVEDIVNQTLVAYTMEAVLSQAAAPPQAATATQTVISTPEENPPQPLPASHTGIILNNGGCFDFDFGQVSAQDNQCDVLLAEPLLLRQQNNAQISGYVTLTAPSRSQCASARYEPGDLAVQTDMYMCLITNAGQIGFFVVRSYGGIPSTGIVFDYWVFN